MMVLNCSRANLGAIKERKKSKIISGNEQAAKGGLSMTFIELIVSSLGGKTVFVFLYSA